MRTNKIYCPCDAFDCPYYKKGECGIEDPVNECDDFGFYYDETDEYEADEPRTAFED